MLDHRVHCRQLRRELSYRQFSAPLSPPCWVVSHLDVADCELVPVWARCYARATRASSTRTSRPPRIFQRECVYEKTWGKITSNGRILSRMLIWAKFKICRFADVNCLYPDCLYDITKFGCPKYTWQLLSRRSLLQSMFWETFHILSNFFPFD